jgi:hypothetical protein
VILLFQANRVVWEAALEAGFPVQLGRTIGRRIQPRQPIEAKAQAR